MFESRCMSSSSQLLW